MEDPQNFQFKRFEISQLKSLKMLAKASLKMANELKDTGIEEEDIVEQEFQGIATRLEKILGHYNYSKIFNTNKSEESKSLSLQKSNGEKIESLIEEIVQKSKVKPDIKEDLLIIGEQLNEMFNLKCRLNDEKVNKKAEEKTEFGDLSPEVVRIMKSIDNLQYTEKIIIKVEHHHLHYPGDRLIDCIYSGETKNGKAHGLGKLKFEYKCKEGDDDWSFKAYVKFEDNKLHGDALFIDGDGWKHCKTYSHGKIHGPWISYDQNNEFKSYLTFENNARNGFGIVYSEGSLQYQGNFVNGEYDGYGEFWFSDDSCFKGQFKNGKMKKGIFTSQQYEFLRKYDSEKDYELDIDIIDQKPIESILLK